MSNYFFVESPAFRAGISLFSISCCNNWSYNCWYSIPSSHSFSEGGKDSQAAIHALAVHIQQNRPRLPTLLSVIYHLSEGEKIHKGHGIDYG
jgi:hypothetical protein